MWEWKGDKREREREKEYSKIYGIHSIRFLENIFKITKGEQVHTNGM